MTSNKVRAILIDPEKRALTEIHIGNGIEEIYAALHCEHFTTGAYLNGSIEKGFDSIFVSDDYLDERDEARFWFQVDADREPPSSHPIAGFGLAHGVGTKGELCDVRISAGDLAKRITYTQRKFKGFKTKTSNTAPHISVTAIAPIIDGTEEVAIDKKSRPESLNAKMLSGKPLITDAQFERLLANAPLHALDQARDPVPVVKIFLPHVRWLLGWIYPHNHDRAYAIMKWGNKEPELGDILLSSIVASRLVFNDDDDGIMPERDLYITLDKPMSCYMQHPDIW